MLAVVGAIVFLESGRRKIAVQYAKRDGWAQESMEGRILIFL